MSSRFQQCAPNPIFDVSDNEDFIDEETISNWITHQNTDEAWPLSEINENTPFQQESSSIQFRNLRITAPLLSLDEYTYKGIRLYPKAFVELRNGEFMRIVLIVRNAISSEVTLRGWIFRRTREMNGVLNHKLNEVSWILHVDDDDPRDPTIQGIESVAITQVVKRRQIRLTNQGFPRLSWRDDEARDFKAVVESDRVLVCRYKYLCFYHNAKLRMSNEWYERAFNRLRADECDKRPDNNTRDEDIRKAWRGDTALGGSKEGWLPGEKDFLRQERLAHDGITSPSVSDSDIRYQSGDSMKRGSVGTLLKSDELLSTDDSSSATLNELTSDRNIPDNYTKIRTTGTATAEAKAALIYDDHDGAIVIASDADDEVDMIRLPLSNTRTQPRRHYKRKRTVAPTFDEWYDISDYDSDGESALASTLRRNFSESSSRTLGRTKGVKIDTQTKILSDTGATRCRYRGNLTSFFSPKSSAFRSRTPMESFYLPRRHGKRTNLGLGGEISDLPNTHTVRNTSPMDSDITLGGSQSDDSIQEMCTPAKIKGHRAKPKLLPPFSLQNILKRNRFPYHSSLTCLRTTSTTDKGLPTEVGKRYTFGDCFCGGGGMSRGGINAGLRIEWGFDFDLRACQTYQLNFFGTPIYNVWADQFSRLPKDFKVDIIHLSPPCQYFSPAHTIPGKNDDMNTASLFAILNLLEKAKPRVVVLEQTFGLLLRHPIYLNAIINMFTSRGFSVRWKVINCADFGLPQRRMRLFMIASW